MHLYRFPRQAFFLDESWLFRIIRDIKGSAATAAFPTATLYSVRYLQLRPGAQNLLVMLCRLLFIYIAECFLQALVCVASCR